MKIGANEIKSASVQSQSPLVVNVTFKTGAIEEWTARQMYEGMTPAARKKVRKLCGMVKNRPC